MAPSAVRCRHAAEAAGPAEVGGRVMGVMATVLPFPYRQMVIFLGIYVLLVIGRMNRARRGQRLTIRESLLWMVPTPVFLALLFLAWGIMGYPFR